MKGNNKNKSLSIEEQAKRYAEELAGKNFKIDHSTYTPNKKEQALKEVELKRRREFWPPFPLRNPDNYGSKDPKFIRLTINAIQRLIRNYNPEIVGFNRPQYRHALDVARSIRLEYPELKQVLLAKNYYPTEQDFIVLEQWFVSALAFAQQVGTAVILDIDDRKILAALNGYNQTANQTDLECDSLIGLSRKTIGKKLPYLQKVKCIYYPKGKKGGISITDLGRKILSQKPK